MAFSYSLFSIIWIIGSGMMLVGNLDDKLFIAFIIFMINVTVSINFSFTGTSRVRSGFARIIRGFEKAKILEDLQ
jgi:hypothetical protein